MKKDFINERKTCSFCKILESWQDIRTIQNILVKEIENGYNIYFYKKTRLKAIIIGD